jgi:sarcosine oxidase subunit delta
MEEFFYGGELRERPAPEAVDDATWGRQLYERQGVPATRREWWYHLPSGYWFIAVRDTSTGDFLESYDAQAAP